MNFGVSLRLKLLHTEHDNYKTKFPILDHMHDKNQTSSSLRHDNVEGGYSNFPCLYRSLITSLLFLRNSKFQFKFSKSFIKMFFSKKCLSIRLIRTRVFSIIPSLESHKV